MVGFHHVKPFSSKISELKLSQWLDLIMSNLSVPKFWNWNLGALWKLLFPEFWNCFLLGKKLDWISIFWSYTFGKAIWMSLKKSPLRGAQKYYISTMLKPLVVCQPSECVCVCVQYRRSHSISSKLCSQLNLRHDFSFQIFERYTGFQLQDLSYIILFAWKSLSRIGSYDDLKVMTEPQNSGGQALLVERWVLQVLFLNIFFACVPLFPLVHFLFQHTCFKNKLIPYIFFHCNLWVSSSFHAPGPNLQKFEENKKQTKTGKKQTILSGYAG